MSLEKKINEDYLQAFKAKEETKKRVLGMLRSEIKNKQIELKKREEGLSDEEAMACIAKAIKQRKDSVLQYTQGGRADLATQEEEEIKILEEYMPAQLSDEEVKKEVLAVVEEMGAKGKADLGKVMGPAMARLRGKADGNKVRQMVEQILS